MVENRRKEDGEEEDRRGPPTLDRKIENTEIER